jgi:pyruvate,water dikinase
VIPDTFRVARDGNVLERTAGLKRIAVRSRADGGTYEEQIDAVRAETLTLDDDQLAQLDRLAQHCERFYGNARDIEWAIADGTLYLLQCRAVTRAG